MPKDKFGFHADNFTEKLIKTTHMMVMMKMLNENFVH